MLIRTAAPSDWNWTRINHGLFLSSSYVFCFLFVGSLQERVDAHHRDVSFVSLSFHVLLGGRLEWHQFDECAGLTVGGRPFLFRERKFHYRLSIQDPPPPFFCLLDAAVVSAGYKVVRSCSDVSAANAWPLLIIPLTRLVQPSVALCMGCVV